MIIHLFDINHEFAVLAFTNISNAIGFMEVDFIFREFFQAICASSLWVFSLHSSNNNDLKSNNSFMEKKNQIINHNNLVIFS